MTHVMTSTSAASLNSTDILMEYMIEVITFDGESETVYVEAYDDAEAQNMAAAQVENADYTMIQDRWVA